MKKAFQRITVNNFIRVLLVLVLSIILTNVTIKLLFGGDSSTENVWAELIFFSLVIFPPFSFFINYVGCFFIQKHICPKTLLVFVMICVFLQINYINLFEDEFIYPSYDVSKTNKIPVNRSDRTKGIGAGIILLIGYTLKLKEGTKE